MTATTSGAPPVTAPDPRESGVASGALFLLRGPGRPSERRTAAVREAVVASRPMRS
jgi:hypothetical protein